MALTLYGSPQSRTMRSLWVLAELKLNFTLVSLEWNDPALKAPAFLALNPAGTIPALVDDGIVVAESMAIALYLARRYGASASAPLYPTDPQMEADVWRWSHDPSYPEGPPATTFPNHTLPTYHPAPPALEEPRLSY